MMHSELHVDSAGTFWRVTSIARLSVRGGATGAWTARHLLRFATNDDERFVATSHAHWWQREVLGSLFDAARPAAIACETVAA